jgi:hypothetical protein
MTLTGKDFPNSIASGAARALASTQSGGWRMDQPFEPSETLKVTLRRERGVTPSGLLTVPFRFQCPPIDRFGRPWRWEYPTRDTLTGGQQLGRGSRQLDVISFQTMFLDLDEGQPWIAWAGSFDAQRLLNEMRAVGDRLATFRLTIGQPALWGPRPLVNMLAVFTAITPEQRGGAVGTEYTDVEFTERRRQQLTRTRARRPSSDTQHHRHTRRHGDTLYSIAKHYYKRASRWRPIAEANGITNVSPRSSEALEDWCAAHHRTTLEIPAITVEDHIESLGLVTP